MTRFDTDTAVIPAGDGVFDGRIDRGWWIVRGPNGGYVAAILVRAMTMAVADETRQPRSLTVHYAEAPEEGPARVRTTIERQGRSLSTVSARLEQDGRTKVLALAAFARSRPGGPEFADVQPPALPPVEDCPPMPHSDMTPPLIAQLDTRWGLGQPPFDRVPAERAEVGGWLRLAEPRDLDHAQLALFADAWIPAVFSRLGQPAFVPTVDLTVHFRAPLPHAGLGPESFCGCVFRTRVVADGFMEEDGELWAPDGTLLAQSRQLAVVIPTP